MKQPRPTGTVTFLFTDIEGSTFLWEHQREEMQQAFICQEKIIRAIMAAHGGYVYKMIGDAFQVAFSTAIQAVAAAAAAQNALHHATWGTAIGELKVRMAIHAGITEERGDDYVGPTLNRIARLLGAGHGGQVLASQAVYELASEALPEGCRLRYLGEFQLKDLIQPEKIYQLDAEGLISDFPPLKVAEIGVRKIPSQNTPFIGREKEIASIKAMLDDPACRLITLHGVGGSGKTRLAIQVCEQALGFPDGVCFIQLAQATTNADIVLGISEAVNLRLYSESASAMPLEMACDQLFQYLSRRNMLLVLDNFEQLVSCSQLVHELLGAAPMLKVMVTSRQRLNLVEEWVLEIGGLPFPTDAESGFPQNFAAMQVFVGAAERNAGRPPSTRDWQAIRRICQLTEGIPLALEMAAAWAHVLTYAEIAEEIGKSLDFLSASWQDTPERHRTLRACFEKSWQLLSAEEQKAFSRLAIFEGSFTREAAFAIAGAALPVLSVLINCSFLRRLDSGRFEIHSILRHYALLKLAADAGLYDETRASVETYFTGWLTTTFEKLKGPDQLSALFSMRNEAPNLASYLHWLVDKLDVPRLSGALPVWLLYHLMNDRHLEMQQVYQLLRELVDRLHMKIGDRDPAQIALLGLTLAGTRYFGFLLNQNNKMRPDLVESFRCIEMVPDSTEKAYAMLLNCINPPGLTVDEIQILCDQCIGLFQRLGDDWGTAMAHLIAGDLNCFGRLNTERARVAYDSCQQGFTRIGCEWGWALCLFGLMYLEWCENHLDEARNLGIATLEIYERMGSRNRMISVRNFLIELAAIMGNLEEAKHLCEENLQHFIQRGDETEIQKYRSKLEQLMG